MRTALPLLAILAGASGCKTPTAQPEASSPTISVPAVRAGVQALQLDADDRVWERIAWSRDIDDAKRRSRDSGRPIFFFSMWGKLDGRC